MWLYTQQKNMKIERYTLSISLTSVNLLRTYLDAIYFSNTEVTRLQKKHATKYILLYNEQRRDLLRKQKTFC